MKKAVIITIIALVIGLIIWSVISTTREINKDIEQKIKDSQNQVSETALARDLKIFETENGKKVWELTAAKAVYAKKNAKLSNIKGKFYTPDSKVILTFEAAEGNYIQDKHQLSLDNGVLVNHPDAKISIQSQTMFWTNESKKDIVAKGQVKIVKKGFGTSYGDKTTFTTDFSKISIEGNTYTEIDFSG